MKGEQYMDFTGLRKFDHIIKRGFHPQIEDHLRHNEVNLLRLINAEPDKPMHFYARQVHLERGSFTYMCENLEMRDLLFRKGDANDRRRKTLRLTQKGNKVVEQLNKQMDEYMEKTLEVFTDEEKTKLKEAVETINLLLPKLPKPPKHPHHPHHPHHHDRNEGCKEGDKDCKQHEKDANHETNQ